VLLWYRRLAHSPLRALAAKHRETQALHVQLADAQAAIRQQAMELDTVRQQLAAQAAEAARSAASTIEQLRQIQADLTTERESVTAQRECATDLERQLANAVRQRDLARHDARSLRRVAQFGSGGVDPHQLLRARDGALVVANGGILRDAAGRGVELARMDPTLALVAPEAGRLLGQWRLADPRLGLRHVAWSDGGERTLLGIGLQAEHERADARRDAPALALWDGRSLTLPCADASAAGYVGDITSAPGGGFVLSAQKAGRSLWWSPAAPERLTRVADLAEPCALTREPDSGAVLIGAGRGIARWRAAAGGQMLRWPLPMAQDHHAVLLGAA
jgi:hypothetical protein